MSLVIMRPRMIVLFFFVAIINFCPMIAAQSEEIKKYSLQQILRIAEEQNPNLAVFSANVKVSEGILRTSRAYPNPELGVEYGNAKPLGISDASYDREYSFGLNQLFEWPGKRSNRIKNAEAEYAASTQDREDFRLDVQARTKEAFYEVVLAKSILEASLKNQETSRAFLQSVSLRVDSGEAPELERIKAQVELLKVTKDFRKAESRTIISKSALNSLLGGTLSNDFGVVDEAPEVKKVPDLSVLIDSAMKNHPALLRQEKSLEASSYALSSEKQSRIPDLLFQGSMSEELDKRSYAFGLSFAMPLFSQRQGEIATAFAGMTRAQVEVNATRAELTNSITAEYQNYKVAAEQLRIFEQGLLKLSEEALQVAQFSYQQGESNLLEFLDAQRTHQAALIEYYEARFELQSALSRLERAAGGSL